MKIKKFRIRPRLSSVGRILKSIMGVKHLPPEVEASLPGEIEDFLPRTMPTAFYQTWAREDMPAAFAETLKHAEASKAVAVSALVATIGAEPEDALSEFLLNGETQRSQVSSAICEESADLCLHFLMRLLADDAQTDDCEISEPISVTDSALLGTTLKLLEAEQEGVTFDSACHLAPRFTRVALVAWWPVARKKKSSQTSKKRSA